MAGIVDKVTKALPSRWTPSHPAIDRAVAQLGAQAESGASEVFERTASGSVARTQALLANWRAGGLQGGQLFQRLKMGKLTSTTTQLVGTDRLGNRYYEDPKETYGRHRWVEYPSMKSKWTKNGVSSADWSYDPTSISADWHGWIHCMTDERPSSMADALAEHTGSRGSMGATPHWTNPTGDASMYSLKGGARIHKPSSSVGPIDGTGRTTEKIKLWVPPGPPAK